MNLMKLIVILVVFAFIGLLLPSISTEIVNGSATLRNSPAYGLVRVMQYLIPVAMGVTIIYWAVEGRDND